MTNTKELTTYLLAFIHGLKESGLKEMVISPGSRSTPLALLAYRDPEINCYINVDERSAAFFALGLAKAQKEPVGLICTSGTAAANYYPAICEAEASNVPLVVLTADRPPEAQGVGAPQTMDQQHLYGSHVKKYIGMALPEEGESFERYAFFQGWESAAAAIKIPKGPVHVNLPFREPLLPDLSQSFTRHYSRKGETINKVTSFSLPELDSWLTKKGLIIVGKELTTQQATKMIELAEIVGWPLLGDPLTNLGNCGKESDNYISHVDLIFADQRLETPEIVWQFGNLPLAKNLMLYLKQSKDLTYVIIDESESWKDWLHQSNYVLPIDPLTFCSMVKNMSDEAFHTHADRNWLSYWQERAKLARQTIETTLPLDAYNESNASKRLFQLLKFDETLFLSNSNAIRFIDRYAGFSKQRFSVYGNRGVNGIDGIISTAAGICAAKKQQMFLLIGDLALFHDMNGLQIIKELELPVTVIVLNNNGGGIFSFLPQRELDNSFFDPLFSTPLHLDLEKVADLYCGAYKKPKSLTEFEQIVCESRERIDSKDNREEKKNSTWTLIEVVGEQKAPAELWQHMIEGYGNRNE
ncbi:2-succinyl-5-enolpyruvyl-6-hydroxy-3-cyclohexene-1-carboxylic-acid synthase [Enterococcus hirae]|uniref:2-succinyl-5-enolpyruvyl-6-hydroxy-3- cyclohexene-1-carboxylic-acid synthase n=1 Tax=Enterococcus hirae TaxID=1354 RepID=UPI00159A6B12|nr:2-succinyl-5-enolpyruvyl-6-hydroxy-3-cyclohexene-1-carboxylic-acid synthase [Enterococcus hirae]QKX68366.1 2-succinyl-5-enolpyruvyl-6-hydroxy-3-cyclohexene-1-carboxylic-acid synthase [Enterococcus hirae]